MLPHLPSVSVWLNLFSMTMTQDEPKSIIDELLNTDDQDSVKHDELDDAGSIIESMHVAFDEDSDNAKAIDDAEATDNLVDAADFIAIANEDDEEDDDDEGEIMIYDADAEDIAEAALAARAVMLSKPDVPSADTVAETGDDEVADEADGHTRSVAELMSIIEALIFVSEEPLGIKTLADVLSEDRATIELAVEGLKNEYDERGSGLMLREIAGGWQIATRPEHHEHLRAFLKAQPSAKLSLPALETLAVIAYKQPVTVPEILEIRGVQSTSAIKTLLDKRLIIAKGRKETVGRPMMYGTSKEFLMQFGLRDLTELPSIEDFEDLAGSAA